MTFLIAINCIMLYGIWAFFSSVSPKNRATPSRQLAALVTFLGTGISSASVFLPLMMPELRWQQATPQILLAGAIMTAVGCAAVLYGGRRSSEKTPFSAAALAALLGCLYLGFTALDHLHFYQDKERTGYLDASIAEEAGVPCARGFILVRLEPDRREATYRCPSNIVFGDYLDQPFVPWPSYREGSSAELPLAIRRLQESASRGRQH
ncbi:hypothetical protein [Pseudoduganella umbonata]|uniref:Uncharacterized protein n=1 Tax=Pseudoduganella umbonata TaxID=864828 RepID=A0A4P8HLD9_9BURK|nr:hypothetical protein [Pseudoduganella umbonata]MBB3221673.1 hypothetical protein [Pseudoduganella umbonata]QCP09100.1 hypothetical protein FCL38_00595 [Pseudoduganella umbonata]